MKRRTSTEDVAMTDVAQVLAAITDPDLIARFLIDLCTPAEVEALVDRWAVVPLLADGMSYRAIHDQTGVSVTTIGRVARCLDHGTGGYAAGLAHRRPTA
ncbi:helix-turn-helix domain-containing protein [Ornithinimicrobium sp. Arc0846-15]|uniref:YerC/YecD family TrpR-related protein n=1 Tax=Ornithinimicrobium sp. INDO-MA30-4 TaxID=2908651 RepID=UPI001C682969|nr:YerC/YecD family TrpR-related protein [Ornithinimicrobium sp. INDO-MA30-4]MBW8173312.1 helix-turn-helix domain-containing protein [Ornithinimicrobium laminariae]UJH71153.1 YerC/YecD family TrpR-related protein [Ornithinimicrobium sp. INDO-MA30-4]